MTKPRKKTLIRFRRQSVRGMAPDILEEHEARYGVLFFGITRRPKRFKYWPGPGVRAELRLGHGGGFPEYYYKAKGIDDAKRWCRMALSYILRGHVPRGDHSTEGG